jgi:glycosyltransferase involved in cell wall biosynthesis
VRITDRNAGFRGSAPALATLERELVSSADLVVYAAEELEPEVRALGARRGAHLPNGVDYEHFARGSRTRPREYDVIPSPIAVYVGAMDRWFDFATIDAAAAALPDVSFVLIGPDRMARSTLRGRPNVHILGPRPFDVLPAYLHAADVGLIPFDVVGHPDLVHAVHPLKLYEYLACGLPVVATRWDEIARLGSPALLCRDREEFIAGIRRTLEGGHDAEAGRAFARAADWRGRVEQLLSLVEPDRRSQTIGLPVEEGT